MSIQKKALRTSFLVRQSRRRIPHAGDGGAEESGDKSAFPECAGHPVKKAEEQQGRENMEDEIGHVVSAGCRP